VQSGFVSSCGVCIRAIGVLARHAVSASLQSGFVSSCGVCILAIGAIAPRTRGQMAVRAICKVSLGSAFLDGCTILVFWALKMLFKPRLLY
jgi:hypothetical protein